MVHLSCLLTLCCHCHARCVCTQVATDVEAFLRSRGHHSVSIVAHSYGTLVASSLVKQHPDRVSSLTLLDPVCFAMFLPHLLRNSLFFHVNEDSDAASAGAGAAGNVEGVGAQPGNRKVVRVGSWLKNPLKGVVVRDVHVAAALSRNNHWAEVSVTNTRTHTYTLYVLSLLTASHLSLSERAVLLSYDKDLLSRWWLILCLCVCVCVCVCR